MKNQENQKLIFQRLSEKSATKFHVYDNTLDAFKKLKKMANEISVLTKKEISKVNKAIPIDIKEKGKFGFELKFAGDLLVATMHTNVFEFPRNNEVMKTSYVKEDPMRSYCGIISMYNFLADSFKYNRVNDVGYLIGRIFINKENHFFVEGKRQIGFLFNNFVNDTVNDEALKKIIESAILYCIDFDLLTPPYDNVKEVSVQEMRLLTSSLSLKTGKRLGFKFQADYDDIV